MQVMVLVHPNSKRARIEKDLFGTLNIHVSQPPLDGKANKAAQEALAEYFQVSKSSVTLIRGAKSKRKTFSVNV